MIETAWEILKDTFLVILIAWGFFIAVILGTAVFGPILAYIEKILLKK